MAEGVLTAGVATVGSLAKLYKMIRKNKTITGRSPISSLSSRMGVDDSTLDKLIKRDNASKASAIRADGLASDLEKSLKKNKTILDNNNFTIEDVDLALKGDQAKLNQLIRIAPGSWLGNHQL